MSNQQRDDTIRELYADGKTISELADLFGLSEEEVEEIIFRSGSVKGEKRNWGPIKAEGRDYKREMLRRYFNHTCQKCGAVWKKGRKFDIHHLSFDSDDSRCYDSGPLNELVQCVTLLCHQCHLNLPGHRKKMGRKNNCKYLHD